MDKNFQKIAINELKIFFDPLTNAAKDTENLFYFFDWMGWDMEHILGGNSAAFFSNIQTIVTAVNSIDQYITTPPQTLPEFAEALGTVLDVVDAASSLPGTITGFNLTALQQLPGEILNKLFVYYLFTRHSKAFDLLRVLKLIEDDNVTPIDDGVTLQKFEAQMPSFRFNKIKDLIADPKQYFFNEYPEAQLNTMADAKLFAKNVYPFLASLFRSIGLDVFYGRGTGPVRLTPLEEDQLETALTFSYKFFNSDTGLSEEVGATIALIPADNGGPAVMVIPYGTLSFFKNIRDWGLSVSVTAALYGLLIKSNTFQVQSGQVSPFVRLAMELNRTIEDGSAFLIGSTTGTRLRIGEFSVGGEFAISDTLREYGLHTEIKQGEIIIMPSDGDSFLNNVLPSQGLTIAFDLIAGWSSMNGFYFKGSGGLDIRIPVHKTILDIIEINDVLVQIKVDDEIKINLATSGSIEIGPVTGIITDVGLSALITFPDNGGNIGPANADLTFKPPTGLGLVIDSDAVKGGGYLFFDRDNARYGGALELSIKDKISLKAIGILTTRLPGNQPGWSLLLMITAEFQPIQLGFGFTLNGVGGLVALHRTMNFNALRDGVRNNTLDNILFPTDPVANINSILSTLEGAFPIQENRYSFGPMAIIGWGTPTLITAEVGLFIEVPDPVRIAIIGVIKAILPDENTALLKLQINFVGTIDFEAKDIFFYAGLFDSKLAWFSLEGSMAFRLRWGNDPIFVLSVGGFHPSFNASGLGLPTLTRITLNLLGGDNPRLTLTNYFAITSNTVQFGAAIDFYFKVTNKIKVLGHLGFDALFQFNPFRFLINVAASLGVYKNDKCLLGVSFSGSLEGPSPWRVRGTGTFKIVIEFNINFDKTFGDSNNASQQNVNVMPQLKDAVTNKANWQGLTPAGYPLLVTVREMPDTPGVVVVHPNSSMAVSQKVVPLGYTINKFGSARPADFTLFDLEISGFTTSPLQEFFARGEFTQLSDGQRLSTKSFEQFKSGLEVKGNDALVSSLFRELQLEYDTIYMDSRYKPVKFINATAVQASAFRAFIGNNAAAKSPLGSQKKPVSNWAPAKVSLKQEAYAVAQTADLALYNSLTASSEAEAEMLLNELLQQQPELEGKLQVVSSYELA